MLRLGRPITSLLGSLAILAAATVAIGTRVVVNVVPVILAMATAFSFTMASNALNDYSDRNMDEINHPERPIPSKKVTPTQALRFSAIMFVVSTVLAFSLGLIAGWQTFLVFLTAIVFQIVYESRIKRQKLCGNLLIGTQVMLAFVFGGSVVEDFSRVGALGLIAFLSIVGREIIKDMEDLKGDTGRSTLPKRLGLRRAGLVATAMLAAAIFLGILLYYPLRVFREQYFVIVLVADAMFLYSLTGLFKNPGKTRRMLRYAMLVAVASFIIGGIFAQDT